MRIDSGGFSMLEGCFGCSGGIRILIRELSCRIVLEIRRNREVSKEVA